MQEKDILAIEGIIGYEFNNSNLIEEAYEASIAEAEYFEDNDIESAANSLIYLSHSVIDSATVSFLASIYGYNDEDFCFTRDLATIDALRLALENKELYSKRIIELGLDKFMYKHRKLYSKAEEQRLRANLFQAIIGAIAADSGYNMQAISKAYTTMLDPMELILTIAGIDYLEEISKWMKLKYSKELSFQIYRTSKRYRATLTIPNQNDLECYHELDLCYDDTEEIYGYGFTEDQAKRDACRACYNYLKDIDKLSYSIFEKDINKLKAIVTSKNEKRAFDIINKLATEGLISKPIIEFSFDDDNREHICTAKINEYSQKFYGFGRTKQKAKAMAIGSLVEQIYDDINSAPLNYSGNPNDEDLPF